MTDASTGAGERRRVHWLELFFDLVMVAYIGQIAHTMHGDPGWGDALVFAVLLAAAWWAWVNASITMNLFGARVTPSIWVAVTVAMLAIGIMAASVPEALGERSAAFAIGNALIRLIWMLPWLMKRSRIGVPWWRPVLYCAVPAALWLASIAFAPPWQYVLWAVAIAIEIALLSVMGGQRDWLRRTLDVDHLVERVGLLVVIVFGESILSIIGELNEHWSAPSWLAALFGFFSVALLAWIFFGYATGAVERGLRRLQLQGSLGGLRDTVMYLPILLIAGVVLFAAGVGTAVSEAGHHLAPGAVVCVAAGVSLFFVASMAESLRYGAPWRDVVIWGPAGVLLPWVLVPLGSTLEAQYVVIAATVVIGILAGLNELNTRRMRAREALAG